MFDIPKSYVLISEEALQSWGKLEELWDMCPVKIVETHSYVKVGGSSLHAFSKWIHNGLLQSLRCS